MAHYSMQCSWEGWGEFEPAAAMLQPGAPDGCSDGFTHPAPPHSPTPGAAPEVKAYTVGFGHQAILGVAGQVGKERVRLHSVASSCLAAACLARVCVGGDSELPRLTHRHLPAGH